MRSIRIFERPNSSYDQLFEQAGQRYNVDPLLIKTVFHIESGGHSNVGRGSSGEIGPFQFMPKTAQAVLPELDPADINQAAFKAAKLLREGLDKTHSVEGAMGYYNSGSTDPKVWSNPTTAAYIQEARVNWNRLYPSNGEVTQVADRTSAANNDKIINDTVARLRSQQPKAPSTSTLSPEDEVDNAILSHRNTQQSDQRDSKKTVAGPTPSAVELSPEEEVDSAILGSHQQVRQTVSDADEKDRKLHEMGGRLSHAESAWQGFKSGLMLGRAPAVQTVNPMAGYNPETGNYSQMPGLQPPETPEQTAKADSNYNARAALSDPEAFRYGSAAGNALTQGALQGGGTLLLSPLVGPVAANAISGAGVGALNTRLNNPNASWTELGESALAGGATSSAVGAAGKTAKVLVNNPILRWMLPDQVTKYLGMGASAAIGNPLTRGNAAGVSAGVVDQLNNPD